MHNLALRCLQNKLHLQIAQTLFADNRIHHVGKINVEEQLCKTDQDLIHTCKNFSLPVTLFDQNMKIVQVGEQAKTSPPITVTVTPQISVFVSCFNLATLSYDARFELVKKMQEKAPKALFIDYEMAERNIAYPMYYTFFLGAYLPLLWKSMLKKNSHAEASKRNVKEYRKNGELEGFIYDIEQKTGRKPRTISRQNLFYGGVGLYYCEWE